MNIQREKVEQAHVVQLLRAIGGRAYVLGTRRRAGDYQGTMQSPGVPDVIGFVPVGSTVAGTRRTLLVFVECKAAGGRLSPDQVLFRELCLAAGVEHVVGDLDAVIAWLVEHGAAKASQFPHYRQPKV